MHPQVADVERRLTQLASLSPEPETVSDRIKADTVLWLCACVTLDDAPIWLVYGFGADGIGWCRVGGGQNVEDLVDAPEKRGDHVDPEDVWEWLDGGTSQPWRRDPWDRSADHVVGEMTRSVRDLTSRTGR